MLTRNLTATNPSVTLTFDDGPSRLILPILNVLKEKEVQAVFFWQSRLSHHKRPWDRMSEDGHQIGSHSQNHPNFAKLSYIKQLEQMKYSKEKLEKLSGNKIKYFRPPFGQFNDDTIKIAKQLNIEIVMWRIASMDWQKGITAESLIKNVTDNLEDGAIILLHELPVTLEALPKLIDAIREKGYYFSKLP
ncbi:polysaccharide deacetylase [Lottiidibacillus patelloidae]|uniref:Polysaccharide deacetylase n=1 Tax=Lottiidibacillus patelloidae TaxID=2670334 RepID=A0A263BW83_9BACI|nr:polysaccharide deacetylase [Lottiidibacillus patelloidae]